MNGYFQVFGLPEQFSLDETILTQTYHILAAKFHPDRTAGASSFEQKQAMMMAAAINEAYRILKNPIDRAAYLLQQQYAIDADAPEHTAFSSDFLMQQMEWREAIAEARAENNTSRLQELDTDITQTRKTLLAQINTAFAVPSPDIEHIAQLIRQGRFLDKLQREIQTALP